MFSKEMREKLSKYYDEISTVILSRQHPVTGLLPASTACNEHGDYNDAWYVAPSPPSHVHLARSLALNSEFDLDFICF
jgi:hypothetical protein